MHSAGHTMISVTLRAALIGGCIFGAAFAFAPIIPERRSPSSILFSSSEGDSNDDGGGIEDFEKERMNIVRNLQRSYYRDVPETSNADIDTDIQSSTSSAGASFDPSTGRINNLTLWRVGWVETPGRRNCLNVHEMQYTHMFETILAQKESSQEPVYFGHLYLPGGTKADKSGEPKYQLKTWHEELADENRFDNYDSTSTIKAPDISTPTVDRSAVVGCLMQIIDHRRIEDGRLMLLVQALERFVVEEVIEEKPYYVANVQVLLDREELPWYNGSGRGNNKEMQNVDENFCKTLRGKAVAASFCYHDYEFDRPKLPTESDKYMTQDDVPWVEISQLLPFAKYSTDDVCLASANERSAHVADALTGNDNDDGSTGSSLAGGSELPMERELWNGGITWDPPPVSNVVVRRAEDTDCDTLETLLWLALDDFCRATGFDLPEEIRYLIPPEMDYLDITTDKYLPSKYPKLRRQKRLSYLAPALIENVEIPMKGMRQVWLNTPSTTARLLGALDRYEYLNNKMMGQFE